MLTLHLNSNLAKFPLDFHIVIALPVDMFPIPHLRTEKVHTVLSRECELKEIDKTNEPE